MLKNIKIFKIILITICLVKTKFFDFVKNIINKTKN